MSTLATLSSLKARLAQLILIATALGLAFNAALQQGGDGAAAPSAVESASVGEPFSWTARITAQHPAPADPATGTPLPWQIAITFIALAGHSYRVQRRDDLSDWTDIGPPLSDGNGAQAALVHGLAQRDETNQWRMLEETE